MIRWVFLDVGNILLDEDYLTFHVFRRHAEAIRQARPDRSFLDLIVERRARVEAGSRWPVFDLTSRYLAPDAVAAVWELTDREIREDYGRWNPPIAGASAMLEALSRSYRLGLIANQPRACRDHLEALGWMAFFPRSSSARRRASASPTRPCFGGPSRSRRPRPRNA